MAADQTNNDTVGPVSILLSNVTSPWRVRSNLTSRRVVWINCKYLLGNSVPFNQTSVLALFFLYFDPFRNFELQLVPNRRLVSPQFGVWSEEGQEKPLSAIDASCHFLHSGPSTVAAFSACRDHALVSY